MKIKILSLSLLLTSVSLHAQHEYPELSRKLDSLASVYLYNKGELRSAHVGISILEPTADKFLYTYQGDKYFTPASNTKILSLYAGLTLLGDNIPALRYIETADTLYFQPTGDPTLLHPMFPAHPAYVFLKFHAKPLVYVPAQTDDPPYGPNWSWDDYAETYQPDRSPMPIYGNIAQFCYYGDTLCVKPRILDQYTFVDRAVMTSGLKVSRDQHANRFTVNLPHRPPRSVVNELPFMTTDSLLSLRMLQDTISRNIGYSGTHPEFYGRWQELPGLPIDTLYRMMMYESDNFIAEQVLWMSSMRTLQRFNTADIIQYLKGGKMFGLPQPVEWHDGSGLSRFNMITPQSMCSVLNRMYREQSRSRLFSLFPTGGTGTLEGRYSSLRGQIFAKTGTLRNNVALSGYLLLPNGNPIIFSVLVSNHNTRPSIVRSAVEDYLIAARKLLSDQVR